MHLNVLTFTKNKIQTVENFRLNSRSLQQLDCKGKKQTEEEVVA